MYIFEKTFGGGEYIWGLGPAPPIPPNEFPPKCIDFTVFRDGIFLFIFQIRHFTSV